MNMHLRKRIPEIIIAMASLGILTIPETCADLVFFDDFEGQPLVGSGNPPGWIVFGNPILDKGTFTTSCHSPTAAVWVAFDWGSYWGWGAETTNQQTYTVDNYTTLSVWMKATNDFSAQSVALYLQDGDGTQWRTRDEDRFQPTTVWTEYTSYVTNMQVESAGTVPGLDYTNIVKFGFLAYANGQSGPNQLQYDDYRVTAIPEPSTFALLATGILAASVRYRRGRRNSLQNSGRGAENECN